MPNKLSVQSSLVDHAIWVDPDQEETGVPVRGYWPRWSRRHQFLPRRLALADWDFLGGQAPPGFTLFNGGVASATAEDITQLGDSLGILRCYAGTDVNGFAGFLVASRTGILLGHHTHTMVLRLKLEALQTAAEDFVIQFGWKSGVNNDAVVAECANYTGGVWRINCTSGVSTSLSSTDIPGSATFWQEIALTVDRGAQLVLLTVNGDHSNVAANDGKGTVTTNIPTTPLGPIFQCAGVATAGGVHRAVFVDQLFLDVDSGASDRG